MSVSRRQLAEAISERLDRGATPKHLAKEVAAYLLETKRTAEVDSLFRDLIVLRAESGDIEASVASAHELTPSVEKEVARAVKAIKPAAKRITLDKKLDQSLIGGIKLNVVNQQLDLSIRAKLNRFKQMTKVTGV